MTSLKLSSKPLRPKIVDAGRKSFAPSHSTDYNSKTIVRKSYKNGKLFLWINMLVNVQFIDG